MGFSSARNLGRDISAGFSPPRRMPISEAVKKFMRVPKGAGNSVPWDPELTPYIIEPMNCLASREYDAVIFVGPARTGKTIGLIDGWIVYTIVCDPSDIGYCCKRRCTRTYCRYWCSYALRCDWFTWTYHHR